MTAYIVRKGAQKKKGILGKREAELAHHIATASPGYRQEKAAEKLRDAHLAVIKCLFHETEAVRPEDEGIFGKTWQKLEKQRKEWEEISSADIIARHSVPEEKHCAHDYP